MSDRLDPARIGYVAVMLIAVAVLAISALSLEVTDARSTTDSGPRPAIAELVPRADLAPRAELTARSQSCEAGYSDNCENDEPADSTNTSDTSDTSGDEAPDPPSIDCQPQIGEPPVQRADGSALEFPVVWTCPADADGQVSLRVRILDSNTGDVVVAPLGFEALSDASQASGFLPIVIGASLIDDDCTGERLALEVYVDLTVDDIPAGTAFRLAEWRCPG